MKTFDFESCSDSPKLVFKLMVEIKPKGKSHLS
jgi:hypothetical protein